VQVREGQCGSYRFGGMGTFSAKGGGSSLGPFPVLVHLENARD
jgi:hypothetical protein